MKDIKIIQKRLDQLEHRVYRKLKKQRLQKAPCNCIHHISAPVQESWAQVVKTPEGVVQVGVIKEEEGELGLCGLVTMPEWNGRLCDTLEIARSCPMFTARYEALDVDTEFERLMQDADYLLQEQPAIYALRWALGLEVTHYTQDLSWWAKWKKKLHR